MYSCDLDQELDLRMSDIFGPLCPLDIGQVHDPVLDRVPVATLKDRCLTFARNYGLLEGQAHSVAGEGPRAELLHADYLWTWITEIIDIRTVLRLGQLVTYARDDGREFSDEAFKVLSGLVVRERDSVYLLGERLRPPSRDRTGVYTVASRGQQTKLPSGIEQIHSPKKNLHLLDASEESLPTCALTVMRDLISERLHGAVPFDVLISDGRIRQTLLLPTLRVRIWMELFHRVSSPGTLIVCQNPECQRLIATSRAGSGATHQRFCQNGRRCQNRAGSIKRARRKNGSEKR